MSTPAIDFKIRYADLARQDSSNELLPLFSVELPDQPTVTLTHADIYDRAPFKITEDSGGYPLTFDSEDFLFAPAGQQDTMVYTLTGTFASLELIDARTRQPIPFTDNTTTISVHHNDLLGKYPVLHTRTNAGVISEVLPDFDDSFSLYSGSSVTSSVLSTASSYDYVNIWSNPFNRPRCKIIERDTMRSWYPLFKNTDYLYRGKIIVPGLKRSTTSFHKIKLVAITDRLYELPVDDLNSGATLVVKADDEVISSDDYQANQRFVLFDTPRKTCQPVYCYITGYTGDWVHLYNLDLNPNPLLDELRGFGNIPLKNTIFKIVSNYTNTMLRTVAHSKAVPVEASVSGLSRNGTPVSGFFDLCTLKLNYRGGLEIQDRRNTQTGGGLPLSVLSDYANRFSCTDYGMYDGAPVNTSAINIFMPTAIRTNMATALDDDLDEALNYIQEFSTFYGDTPHTPKYNEALKAGDVNTVVDFIIRRHIDQFIPAGINYTLEYK